MLSLEELKSILAGSANDAMVSADELFELANVNNDSALIIQILEHEHLGNKFISRPEIIYFFCRKSIKICQFVFFIPKLSESLSGEHILALLKLYEKSRDSFGKLQSVLPLGQLTLRQHRDRLLSKAKAFELSIGDILNPVLSTATGAIDFIRDPQSLEFFDHEKKSNIVKQLAGKSIDIFLLIIQRPELRRLLNGKQFTEMYDKHIKNSQRKFEENLHEALAYAKNRVKCYKSLNTVYPENLNEFIDNCKLALIDADCFIAAAKNNLDILDIFLNNYELLVLMLPEDLNKIGMEFEAVALKIFTTPELYNKQRFVNVQAMARKYAKICSIIFQKEYFFSLLSNEYIFISTLQHPYLINSIFIKQDMLKEKLYDYLLKNVDEKDRKIFMENISEKSSRNERIFWLAFLYEKNRVCVGPCDYMAIKLYGLSNYASFLVENKIKNIECSINPNLLQNFIELAMLYADRKFTFFDKNRSRQYFSKAFREDGIKSFSYLKNCISYTYENSTALEPFSNKFPAIGGIELFFDSDEFQALSSDEQDQLYREAAACFNPFSPNSSVQFLTFIEKPISNDLILLSSLMMSKDDGEPAKQVNLEYMNEGVIPLLKAAARGDKRSQDVASRLLERLFSLDTPDKSVADELMENDYKLKLLNKNQQAFLFKKYNLIPDLDSLNLLFNQLCQDLFHNLKSDNSRFFSSDFFKRFLNELNSFAYKAQLTDFGATINTKLQICIFSLEKAFKLLEAAEIALRVQANSDQNQLVFSVEFFISVVRLLYNSSLIQEIIAVYGISKINQEYDQQAYDVPNEKRKEFLEKIFATVLNLIQGAGLQKDFIKAFAAMSDIHADVVGSPIMRAYVAAFNCNVQAEFYHAITRYFSDPGQTEYNEKTIDLLLAHRRFNPNILVQASFDLNPIFVGNYIKCINDTDRDELIEVTEGETLRFMPLIFYSVAFNRFNDFKKLLYAGAKLDVMPWIINGDITDYNFTVLQKLFTIPDAAFIELALEHNPALKKYKFPTNEKLLDVVLSTQTNPDTVIAFIRSLSSSLDIKTIKLLLKYERCDVLVKLFERKMLAINYNFNVNLVISDPPVILTKDFDFSLLEWSIKNKNALVVKLLLSYFHVTDIRNVFEALLMTSIKQAITVCDYNTFQIYHQEAKAYSLNINGRDLLEHVLEHYFYLINQSKPSYADSPVTYISDGLINNLIQMIDYLNIDMKLSQSDILTYALKFGNSYLLQQFKLEDLLGLQDEFDNNFLHLIFKSYHARLWFFSLGEKEQEPYLILFNEKNKLGENPLHTLLQNFFTSKPDKQITDNRPKFSPVTFDSNPYDFDILDFRFFWKENCLKLLVDVDKNGKVPFHYLLTQAKEKKFSEAKKTLIYSLLYYISCYSEKLFPSISFQLIDRCALSALLKGDKHGLTPLDYANDWADVLWMLRGFLCYLNNTSKELACNLMQWAITRNNRPLFTKIESLAINKSFSLNYSNKHDMEKLFYISDEVMIYFLAEKIFLPCFEEFLISKDKVFSGIERFKSSILQDKISPLVKLRTLELAFNRIQNDLYKINSVFFVDSSLFGQNGKIARLHHLNVQYAHIKVLKELYCDVIASVPFTNSDPGHKDLNDAMAHMTKYSELVNFQRAHFAIFSTKQTTTRLRINDLIQGIGRVDDTYDKDEEFSQNRKFYNHLM